MPRGPRGECMWRKLIDKSRNIEKMRKATGSKSLSSFCFHLLSALLAFIFLLAGSLSVHPEAAGSKLIPISNKQARYRVTKVLDGDTLLVDKIGEVRLIGVDTPEVYHPLKPEQYFGRQASDFVRQLVEGKSVRLAFDNETKDKYGRTLAYVYLEDGRCLNEEIIKQGYGFALTRFPFRWLVKYRQLEAQARRQGLGLWANGGLEEFRWLQSQKVIPYEIYEMANNWWGIRYKEYVRLRIGLAELSRELENLRRWTNELSPSDLEKTLLKNGWMKIR